MWIRQKNGIVNLDFVIAMGVTKDESGHFVRLSRKNGSVDTDSRETEEEAVKDFERIVFSLGNELSVLELK